LQNYLKKGKMNANQAFTSPPPPQEEKLQKLTEK
jgi:hypothetical protein